VTSQHNSALSAKNFKQPSYSVRNIKLSPPGFLLGLYFNFFSHYLSVILTYLSYLCAPCFPSARGAVYLHTVGQTVRLSDCQTKGVSTTVSQSCWYINTAHKASANKF